MIDEIKQYADPKIAQHSAKFFKTQKGEYGEGDKFLGIRVPTLRQLSRKYRAIKSEDALLLLRNEYHEIRLLALFILTFHFEKAPQKIYTLYVQNTIYINNWDLVDSSAHKIVGRFLMDKERAVLYRLIDSANLWERRIALIATFWFIKHNELNDTLALCKRVLDDKEDLIHKASGWMLREVGKKDRATLEDFLQKHHKIMPRVMLRYALEKFSKAERHVYMA